MAPQCKVNQRWFPLKGTKAVEIYTATLNFINDITYKTPQCFPLDEQTLYPLRLHKDWQCHKTGAA